MIDTKNSKSVCKLQLQPQYQWRREWEAIAEREGLSYEVQDLFAPPALNESRLFERYKDWYLRSGRTTSVHGAYIDVNPGSGDALFRELSRRRCRESCALAKELGAENIVFHSSCVPFLRGAYLENWAQACARFYEELASEYDVHLFIENSQDIDAKPIKELMLRTKDPRIGVCLDIGHACYSRCSLDQWTQELGAWIGYMHLSDNWGLFDDHIPLGEGIAQLEEADRFWRESGRTMYMTLEVGGPEGAEQSLRYLKKHGLFGMDDGRISQ